MPNASQLGFLSGAKSLFAAFRFLARTPEAWPSALVPAVLFLLLSAFATLGAWIWVGPTLLETLGLTDTESWWAGAGSWLLSFLVSLLSTVVGFWVSLLITPSLSAPAMEHLVQLQETELHVPPRKPMGFLNEFLCGLRAQMFAVVFATPILAILWLIGALFPPTIVVTAPLNLLVLAAAVAWNLLDYPLTLRGVGATERFGFIATHWRSALGFGLTFAALFYVPCFGVLMLPVGVVAATRLLVGQLVSETDELPQLPRPKPPEFSGLDGVHSSEGSDVPKY